MDLASFELGETRLGTNHVRRVFDGNKLVAQLSGLLLELHFHSLLPVGVSVAQNGFDIFNLSRVAPL